MTPDFETESAIFGKHAPYMAKIGLAVLPLKRDRTPLVSGFNKWRWRPPVDSVNVWAENYPGANIGIVPGLSDLIVVDNDDLEQDELVESLCGPTPLTVRSNRGRHRYYRKPQDALPGNLRSSGLNADIKSGNSIVIAPPSIHHSGKIYTLESGDWSALEHIPHLDIKRLLGHLRKGKPETSRAGGMRDGSRGQWLNDQLCRDAPWCDEFSEVLDKAHTLNAKFADPLSDEEVVKRAAQVWKDVEDGTLKPWVRGSGVAKASRNDLERLSRVDPKRAPDAFYLLTKLRLEHGARSRRGETFCITPKAMATAGVIPSWDFKRYVRARKVLLDAKLVIKVSSFKSRGRVAAQYILPDEVE